MKTWTCKVTLTDGRCGDGCCGDVKAHVTSPVTGRTVVLDHRFIPTEARNRILQGIADQVSTPEGFYRPVLNGSCSVRLSKSDLETILEHEGESLA